MKSLMPQIDSNDGLFHNGNPATGEQGTRVTDTWLNNLQDRVRDVQAEAHYVLQKAGFRPVENKQTQLYEAIVKIIDDNRKTASLTQKGEVRLTSDTGLDSEELGLTARAGKKLAQLIATVQLALNNYIPLNKRSSAVNSSDENNVATSKAVKTAYDKGVDAKNAADNANNNANGRVSKSGDTMTGMLTITNSSTAYRVNNYNWPKKIELSGDSVIGNEISVIGFNNNGALHLGGKPNSNEFNASIDETGLWVKGDVVTKSGASLNNAFMKTGGVVTGDTSFKQGDWSGINLFNLANKYTRLEVGPDSSRDLLTIIYRNESGQNQSVVTIPKKNGEVLLNTDITSSLSNNGWCKLPNGLIMQWGISNGGWVNFPIAFPHQCFSVIGTPNGGGNYENYSIFNISNTRFFHKGKYDSDANNAKWIAIGN